MTSIEIVRIDYFIEDWEMFVQGYAGSVMAFVFGNERIIRKTIIVARCGFHVKL